MHYVIIGGNAAGLSAAMRILKQDSSAQISIFEAGEVISFGSCGMPYYIAGEFDDIERMTARPLTFFQEKGINIQLQHRAIKLEANTKTIWIQNQISMAAVAISYDKLLFATGARPRHLELKGIEGENIYHLHQKQDAIALKTLLPTLNQVVILGAGFIGLEMVEALVAQQKKVTLLQLGKGVLETQFDSEIGELLIKELQQQGVALQLEESVITLERDTTGRLTAVVGQHARYPADLLLIAIGLQPNTEFLNESGIKLAKNGAIIIDALCQTSLPDIYAAGDCATVPHQFLDEAYIPLATTANKLGRLAGDAMTQIATSTPFIGTLGASGIRLFGLEAARVGLSEKQAKQQQIDFLTVWVKDKNHTDYVYGQSNMWIKLIYRSDNRQIIGAQLCGQFGSGAVYRVDVLAVAIYKKLTVEELGMMDFVYAPPFSRPWDILNIAGNVAP